MARRERSLRSIFSVARVHFVFGLCMKSKVAGFASVAGSGKKDADNA
jgi:hypothetical protein